MRDLAIRRPGADGDDPGSAAIASALDEVARGMADRLPEQTVLLVADRGRTLGTHSTQPLDPVIVDALHRLVTMHAATRGGEAIPDGSIRAVETGPAAGWSGYRRRAGGGVVAAALAYRPETTVARPAVLELAALELARAVLLQEDGRRRDQIDQLLVTARRVADSLELDTVLTSIVEDATALLGADSGDILLWDREQGKLRVVAVSNFPPEMLGFEAPFGEGLSSQAILSQQPLEVIDYGAYEHRMRELDHYDFGSVLCAPLLFRGRAIGAINVHARGRLLRFPPASADLLAAFAGHAAIAIDHARRYENEVRLGRDLARANQGLTRLLTVHQRLAERVLLDGGPGDVASVLAEDLGRDVVIQDQLRRHIAGASPGGGEGWRRLVAREAGPGMAGSSGASGAGRSAAEPFAVAVRVGREVAGHLLLSSDDDLGPIDRALVDAATTGVALAFAKVRAALEVEERLYGEAAADLLRGTYASEEAIAARAARLGHDLDEPRDLLVLDIGDAIAPSDDGQPGHDRLRRALDLVRERLAVRAPRSLAVVHAGVLVVLARTARPNDLSVDDLARELQTALAGLVDAGPVTVAIADRCHRPDDYPTAFRLARETGELMVRLGRAGVVIGTAELGPYGLLLRASSRQDLEAFARRTLRPLLEPGRGHGADLLHTLRVFLEEDRVQRRAAARCFVHVNTIVYRIHRIQELLGVDLAQPSAVFDLTLALRILDLLGDTPAVERPSRP